MKLIFQTILPGWTGTGVPVQFPFMVRFALRASVLIAHIFSIFSFGLPFNMIGPVKREMVMRKLYYHRSANIRNIVQFWKMTAFMTQTRC